MTDLSFAIHHHAVLKSTNDEAIRLALEGAPEGTVVTADLQTKGRGRDGRTWESGKGSDLLLSLLLRPPIKASQASGLTLVAAHAVQKTLEGLGISSKIKKPNDVLVNGKKIAGILTESQSKGAHLEWCVVGVGLDVNSVKGEIPEEAVSIRMILGKEADLGRIKAEFLENFKTQYLPHVTR
jgi:BirA family biotin operon repressor/biotin-[acetyl-CoA-carboxylase] ligase